MKKEEAKFMCSHLAPFIPFLFLSVSGVLLAFSQGIQKPDDHVDRHLERFVEAIFERNEDPQAGLCTETFPCARVTNQSGS